LQALSDVRRRRYSWASRSYVVWAHFPSVNDFVRSLAGERNLMPDDDKELCFAIDNGLTPLTYKYACPANRSLPVPKHSLLTVTPEHLLEASRGRGVHLKHLLAACDRVGFCDLEAAELILQRAPELLNQVDSENGFTPLIKASIRGHAPLVERLLELRADVDRRGLRGYSALSRAVLHAAPGAPAVVRLLLHAGADPGGRFSQREGRNAAAVTATRLARFELAELPHASRNRECLAQMQATLTECVGLLRAALLLPAAKKAAVRLCNCGESDIVCGGTGGTAH